MAKLKPGPKPTTAPTLDAIGIDAICVRVECGESMREIALSIGISVSGLSAWMNSDDNREQSARAREASAESWLDRGLDAIASAMDKSVGIDPSAAKAYAQECARRAALRNPRYIEKTAHEVTGANGGPMHTSTEVTFKIVRPGDGNTAN